MAYISINKSENNKLIKNNISLDNKGSTPQMPDENGNFKDFLLKIGEKIQNYVGATQETIPERLEAAAKNLGKKAIDISKYIFIQAPARATASLTAEFLGTGEIKPETKAEKFFFGEETVKPIGQVMQESIPVGQTIGEKILGKPGKALGGVFAPFIAGGLTVLDLIPFGGSEKNLAKLLLKTKTADEATQILKKAGVADYLIKKYASKFAKLDKIEDVNKELESLKNTIQSTKLVEKELPTTKKLLQQELVEKQLQTGKEAILESQARKLLKEKPIQLGEEVLTGKKIVEANPDPLSKLYQKMFDNASDVVKAEKALSENIPNPDKLPEYEKIVEGINSYWNKINETIQDDWYKVRKLVQEKGIKVSDETNPYLKKELYVGRVDYQINKVKEEVINIDNDILKTSQKLAIDDKELLNDVNKFLIARHAPERNLAIKEGAAGITTEEANKLLEQIKSKPYFKEVERIANGIQELNNKTLDVLLDGQVIDKEFYDVLKSKYKYHIPLQRVFDENEDIVDVLVNSGLDVKFSGIYRAKGSEEKVADILTNITANLEAAIIRAEKNKVDLATLKFIRENNYLGGIVEEIKPKVIGKLFDGSPVFEKINDSLALTLRENGKPVYLKFKDKELAAIFKGINRQKLDIVTRTIASITRMMSGLATRFNPDFALPNKIRDLQESIIYAASRKEIGGTNLFKKELDTKSIKGVVDYLRGKNTPEAKLYEELKSLGGTTGGLSLSTRKAVELDIDKIRKLNRSDSRKAAQKIIEGIDNWNTIFEDSTRLSVYRAAIERGVSKERAAWLAKEATINFNRMGTAGPIINALYMFSNASIQGSVKMLRALRNPKILAVTSATIVGSLAVINEWNDKIDSNWRDKVSKWDRLNGIPVVLPSEDKEKFNYFVIPVGWGIKPMVVIVNNILDVFEGNEKDIEEAIGEVLTAVIDAYNPLGGTDFVQAVTPSIADIPIDILRNKKWTGSKIKPDYDEYIPQSQAYFDSLKDTFLGETLIKITDEISEKSGHRIEISPADLEYALKQYVSGAGRFIEKLFETGKELVVEQQLTEVKEIPFISRFIRRLPIEETGYGTERFEEIKRLRMEQSRENIKLKREAEMVLEQIKKLPKNQRIELLNKLEKENPDLLEKILNLFEQEEKNLTGFDKIFSGLNSENKAKYILNKIKEIKDKNERIKFLNELEQKGFLTDDVLENVSKLLNQ